MDFRQKIILGRTGLEVGRLGISSSFGAPAKAYLEAFEEGCNYFTWGTFIKGRANAFKSVEKNRLICQHFCSHCLQFFCNAMLLYSNSKSTIN